MNLYFRLILVLISGLLSKTRTSIMDVHSVWFRVLPNDLDTNLHMNNGRYLTIMDLGRTDAILRSGLFRSVIKKKMDARHCGSVDDLPPQPFTV
jgi:acyl-ACP thioesterase